MIIALDAGHYIGTPGRRCLKKYDPNETREWQLNSRICEKIENILAGYECDVIRCDDRTGATDTELSERCKISNNAKADFFLSVHHNAGINGGKGGGITAFSYTGSAKGKPWRDDLYNALIRKTGLAGNRAEPRKEAGYYVIKNTTAPAVLLELGFMDSATDIPVIISDEYASLCAEAISEVIVDRLNIPKIKETEESAKAESTYAKVEDVPDWGRATIKKLVEKGYLKGVSESDLGLDLTMLRILVLLDRAGNFN